MPKVDPITGCTVATTAEVIASMARAEGKTPDELREELRQEEADDQRREEEALRQPATALEVLRSAWREEFQAWEANEAYGEEYGWMDHYPDYKTGEMIASPIERTPRPIEPVEVLEVLDVSVSWTFRESKQHLKARARGDDGVEHVFVLDSWHYSGSFYEPPSSEWELVIDPNED